MFAAASVTIAVPGGVAEHAHYRFRSLCLRTLERELVVDHHAFLALAHQRIRDHVRTHRLADREPRGDVEGVQALVPLGVGRHCFQSQFGGERQQAMQAAVPASCAVARKPAVASVSLETAHIMVAAVRIRLLLLGSVAGGVNLLTA